MLFYYEKVRIRIYCLKLFIISFASMTENMMKSLKGYRYLTFIKKTIAFLVRENACPFLKKNRILFIDKYINQIFLFNFAK